MTFEEDFPSLNGCLFTYNEGEYCETLVVEIDDIQKHTVDKAVLRKAMEEVSSWKGVSEKNCALYSLAEELGVGFEGAEYGAYILDHAVVRTATDQLEKDIHRALEMADVDCPSTNEQLAIVGSINIAREELKVAMRKFREVTATVREYGPFGWDENLDKDGDS